MDMVNLNLRAADMNRRLFDLCYELGQLELAARRTVGHESVADFAAAVAAVKAAQEKLQGADLVIDAARDEKDQSYAVATREI